MDINFQYDPKRTKIGSILVLLGPKLTQKWFLRRQLLRKSVFLSPDKKRSQKPLYGESYLMQNHFWVHFGLKGPKQTHFCTFWVILDVDIHDKNNFGHSSHISVHRNQMMAISCLKTSFLGSKNQFFNFFEFFLTQIFSLFFC